MRFVGEGDVPEKPMKKRPKLGRKPRNEKIGGVARAACVDEHAHIGIKRSASLLDITPHIQSVICAQPRHALSCISGLAEMRLVSRALMFTWLTAADRKCDPDACFFPSSQQSCDGGGGVARTAPCGECAAGVTSGLDRMPRARLAPPQSTSVAIEVTKTLSIDADNVRRSRATFVALAHHA
ncbi:MAG TPA: hypothetical protein VK540_34315 [Polyangiaceae bacterium]|nr:hypothetical protein [Polyangiaceae bacterium]